MKLLFSHILISIIIALICAIKDLKNKFFLYLMVSLFLPVSGYIISIFIVLTKNKKRNDISYYDEEEIAENNILFTNEYGEVNSKNIVSLEETIIVNNDEIKKEQLMRCLQANEIRNVSVLKLAVKDEDIETAHYASVAMIDMRSRFELNIRESAEAYEKNNKNKSVIINYKQEIKKYLDSNLIDDNRLNYYRKIHIELLEKLIKLDKEKSYYEEIIDSLIAVNQLDEAKKYCDEFIEQYECEEAYIKQIKYFYEIDDRKSFYESLEKLKKSSINLSREGLKTLRFWNDEVITDEI